MDTRTTELLRLSEESLETSLPTENDIDTKHLVSSPLRQSARPGARPGARRPKKKSHVRVGREVVKTGMAASLSVALLTGLKVLRPMSVHPMASWIFLGLTVLHMVAYDKPGRSSAGIPQKRFDAVHPPST